VRRRRTKAAAPPIPEPTTNREACADHADHDLSLRFDPAYEKISRRSTSIRTSSRTRLPGSWFKLAHRDMGPIARYLGPLVRKRPLIWQDPIPAVNHPLIGREGFSALKAKILSSG